MQNNNNQPPPYYPYPPSGQPPSQYPSMGPSPSYPPIPQGSMGPSPAYPPIPQGPYGASQPQDPYAQWSYGYPPPAPSPPQNNYYGGNNYYGYPNQSGPSPPPPSVQNQPQGQYWDGGYQQNSWRPDQYNMPYPVNSAQSQQSSQPNNNADNLALKANMLMGFSNESSPPPPPPSPPVPIVNRPVMPEPPIINKTNMDAFNITKDQTYLPTPSFDSNELKRKADLLLNGIFDSNPAPPHPNIEFEPKPNIILYDINPNPSFHPNPKPIFDSKPRPEFLQNYNQGGAGVIDESTLLDIDLNERELAKVKSILETGKVFVDHEFPAEEKSVFDLPNSEQKYNWKDITWKRPEDFFKTENYEVFQSNNNMMKSMLRTSKSNREIESGDILQGIIGDCYFLSSISSLAESNPERILKLFLTKKKVKAGVYCVRLCLEGEWKLIYVDSLIPCYKNGGPCFTKSHNNQNEIWVLILEKAYAKAFSNYERIEAGLSREALRELTGASIDVVFDDNTKLWDKILEGTKKNFVMTAGSKEEGDLTQTKVDKGIYASHAYSLLGAFEIMGEKVVKMRNPWGEKEWKVLNLSIQYFCLNLFF